MSSPQLEDTMNALFRREISLSPAQIGRLARANVGVLLAGHAQLPKIARWLDRPESQAGRIQFLQRLLNAPFMTQELVYQPLVRGMLRGFQEATWHILIDRSTLEGYEAEMLMSGLSFRGHAVPLVWEVIDFGCTSADEQIALWHRVLPLIPPDKAIVAHGDTEFGSVKVMRFMREHGWDFILGQPANTRYRLHRTQTWHLLSDLPVTKRQPIYLPAVEWTENHCYGPLGLFAFYAPRQNSPESPRRDIRYQATTLPIAHTLRRVGRRRWGIEPFFKDYKSAGWNIELSALSRFDRRNSLLILLSTAFLWATCVGRWLCKIGKRRHIDAKPSRQLSLFRIGWDWLVAQYRQGHDWPLVTTLYS
jgi:hypothetical protein